MCNKQQPVSTEWPQTQTVNKALISKFAGFLETQNKTNRSGLTEKTTSSAPCHSSAWTWICTEKMQLDNHYALVTLAFMALIFNTSLQVLFWSLSICLPTQYPTLGGICSQRIPSLAEVPGNRSAPTCPLCLLPPELHKTHFSSSHPSLSLATSKLLQAGNTSLTSHSLKAAGRLLFFYCF